MKSFVPTLFACSLISFSAVSGKADQITVLGSASTFAVLGSSTVTNTGNTVLYGNLGLSPGTSITGFPPGQVLNGTTHDNDAVAALARLNAVTAYSFLSLAPQTQNLTGQDLSGLTLGPGVYNFDSSAQLSGPLTLDFHGLNDANIIFKIGSTLVTSSGSLVKVINRGTDDNVYYQVGSSATLGTGSTFQGDIIALASITLTTGANITCGNAIALNGAVTLDTNVIHNCNSTGSNVTPDSTPSPVPEPGTLGLVGTGLLGMAGAFRRRLLSDRPPLDRASLAQMDNRGCGLCGPSRSFIARTVGYAQFAFSCSTASSGSLC